MKSVLLLSGGLDSAAQLALAQPGEIVLALTFDYGQRAAAREVEAARGLCAEYGVIHQVVHLPWLSRLGQSALTHSNQKVPDLSVQELDDPSVIQASARAVWVPNRNGIFFAVGAAYAEALGAQRVLAGFNREEAVTFSDNRPEFLEALTASFRFSTAHGVQAASYTTHLDKRQIVQLLKTCGRSFPLDRVWSCYLGGAQHCGSCESCMRMTRAMREATQW